MKKVFDSYEEAFEYAKTLPWKYTEKTYVPDSFEVTYNYILVDSDDEIYWKNGNYEQPFEILTGEDLNDDVLKYLIALHNGPLTTRNCKI